jgi:anti-sigma28 factor (negative regulator of flagellin synthesis)
MPWISCKRVSKREAQLRKLGEEKERGKKVKEIKKEIFRATRAIYTELLASRLPHVFEENS